MSASVHGSLFVICAPSGAGKTSLVRALVNERLPELRVSVSHTTRARRPGEIEGRDYHFVSRADFQAMIAAGDLLEHALVYDHYYGTSRSWVLQGLADADVVLEIDWQGARQIRTAYPDCVSIQVIPPSLAALEDRLRRRGQDSEATIARRMQAAVEEMAHFAEFDFLIVNDDFEPALAQLHAIVLAERARLPRMRERHPTLLAQLLGARRRPDGGAGDAQATGAGAPPPPPDGRATG